MKVHEVMKVLLWAGLMGASLPAVNAHAGSNLVTKPSNYTVSETIDRIEKAVTAKGMKIFARINHSGEAKSVGLEMKPTEL